MAAFSERLKELRTSRGLSQEELGKNLGISKGAINNYEHSVREPKLEMLEAIADFFNVDMDYLLGKSNIPNRVLINEYNNITTAQINNISLISNQKIPMLKEIAYGKPIYADEKDSYIEIGPNIKADFYIKYKGDSMIGARILDGDIVFVKRQTAIENGEIFVVVIENEITLKRVYYYPEEKTMRLLSENPKYKPIVYTGVTLEQIHILGKAVAFLSDLK